MLHRMESYTVVDNKMTDVESDTQMLHALLLILDSLLLSPFKNSKLYKQKTVLFTVLKDIIKAKKVKNMPLFVPTKGGLSDYYSSNEWVFPIYHAKEFWDLESTSWRKRIKRKLKSNKHKF